MCDYSKRWLVKSLCIWICRIGGRENFYHCDVCDVCLSISMKDNHKVRNYTYFISIIIILITHLNISTSAWVVNSLTQYLVLYEAHIYRTAVFPSWQCIEKSSHSNCPVCLEDLHTSRIAAHIPPCGHLIH